MSKVIAYKNSDRVCFCQIRFDNKERVLVSYANVPEPGFKVIKLLAGIIPFTTIWEYSVTGAGEKEASEKLIEMFTDGKKKGVTHPLDAIILKLAPCKSCKEAARAQQQSEGNFYRNT